jgi:hypothetical protein
VAGEVGAAPEGVVALRFVAAAVARGLRQRGIWEAGGGMGRSAPEDFCGAMTPQSDGQHGETCGAGLLAH